MTFSSFDGRPRIDSSLSKLAIWRVAARRHRLIAGNSTRGVPRARPTTPPKGETSRNINSACLPLRACRPSGGFVLETLAARLAPRQTAGDRRESTGCGKACARDVAGHDDIVERASE